MKKILPLLSFLLISTLAFSQSNPDTKKKKEKPDVSNRPNDHFMVQFGLANWSGLPDTIDQRGFSKTFNVYFLFDFPFKTNPHISVAIGPGIGTDHILFAKTHVGIKDLTGTFPFTNLSDTDHYKKTKLATAYLEAPLELRYSADPVNSKGFKAALGIKIGTLINAHTRNAKFENRSGTALNSAVLKESSKRFFNKNRVCFTGRVGLGHISLFASYQVTPLIKDGAGPVVKPYSIGLTLSGL
jgi:hypothetical protein